MTSRLGDVQQVVVAFEVLAAPVLEPLAAEIAASSSLRCWIIVPIAPSRMTMRSRSKRSNSAALFDFVFTRFNSILTTMRVK